MRYTIERDGFIGTFDKIGAKVFANACGPCIGMWARMGAEKQEKNTIVHSFNRNFKARNDSNPNTFAFVASPELVTALALAGDLTFNPITDTLVNAEGKAVKLEPPSGDELPSKGFAVEDNGYQAPAADGSRVQVVVDPKSSRLQLLDPFRPGKAPISSASASSSRRKASAPPTTSPRPASGSSSAVTSTTSATTC